MVELVVFVIAGAVCLAGALGVVASRNPVHAALSLVATLFGIAVLFVAQEAHFLAAVQVIVYAGAIVVLLLFVLMLLGVDQAENLRIEPLRGQRVAAIVVGLGVLALPLLALTSTSGESTGARPVPGSASEIADGVADVDQIGRSLFTDYLFAFEVTSILLVIAVVAAVVMSRKIRRADMVEDPLALPAEPDQPDDSDQPDDPDQPQDAEAAESEVTA